MLKEHIIFEDDTVIVCRKPAGLATQTPVLGQSDLVSQLKNYRAERKEEPYIGLVHRLDQPVEGIMVFAKTKEAAAFLSKQMAERDFVKEYYAVLEGKPEKEKDTLTHWLIRDGRTNTGKVVPPNTAEAKEAKLDYEVLEIIETGMGIRSLVKVHLHTGRHHQIRLQTAAIGCPIVGDRKYGNRQYKGYEPLSLCSCRINFVHPKTKERMDFTIQPQGKQFHQFSCQL